MKPTFFATPEAFRRWLEKHHGAVRELWIGFHKVHTGSRGMTYAQAVDEALCFGWIDGQVKRFDDEAFMQRFTPRKARSTWSEVNVRKVRALDKAGRMAPPWVTSAKLDETRKRRLGLLIADSGAGRRLAPLAPAPKKPAKA